MSPWILLSFVFGVWCLWAITIVAERAVEDARRGIPKGQRGATSVVPGIPLFPLALWGAAWLIDYAASPWGTVLVGAAHLVFAVALAVTLVRGWWFLRSLDGRDSI